MNCLKRLKPVISWYAIFLVLIPAPTNPCSIKDEEDLFVRSTGANAAKKFVGDVVSGVGQKAPKYASEHSQRVAHNDRMSRPGFAQTYDIPFLAY